MPRARKRDCSGSQATVEQCRPRWYDNTTTSPRKTNGVERKNAVVPTMQTHKGLPTRSWLKASGLPHERGVGFLSEDPTRTYDALAEIKKWREFLEGLRDNPVDLAVLLNEDGRQQVDWWRKYFKTVRVVHALVPGVCLVSSFCISEYEAGVLAATTMLTSSSKSGFQSGFLQI